MRLPFSGKYAPGSVVREAFDRLSFAVVDKWVYPLLPLLAKTQLRGGGGPAGSLRPDPS